MNCLPLVYSWNVICSGFCCILFQTRVRNPFAYICKFLSCLSTSSEDIFFFNWITCKYLFVPPASGLARFADMHILNLAWFKWRPENRNITRVLQELQRCQCYRGLSIMHVMYTHERKDYYLQKRKVSLPHPTSEAANSVVYKWDINGPTPYKAVHRCQ